MKKNIRVLSRIFLIIFLVSIISTTVLAADPAISLDDWRGDVSRPGHTSMGGALNVTLTILQIIGVTVALIMLIVLGIKYMISSVSDRAEIKKHAIVYVTGAVLMFAASGIVEIIKKFSTSAIS